MTEEEIYEENFDDVSAGNDVSATEDSLLDYSETVIVDDRGFYTTSFDDYTVTEGLLLLIFVILFVDFFIKLVRRWF